MPNITSIAGRHAADRERERHTELVNLFHHRAFEALDDALRAAGLKTHPHFAPQLHDERSLWVECRLATAQTDHERVYAVLDDMGWQPDRERLSRFRGAYDVVRLQHAETGARLVVIVRMPTGAMYPMEAA